MLFAQHNISGGEWHPIPPLGFDIQTDHLISARWSDLIIINNKKKDNLQNGCFAVSADHGVKLKVKNSINISTLIGNGNKIVEYENYVYINYKWCACYNNQNVNKGNGARGNKRTNEDHPHYYITDLGQNIEKSLGDLRRLSLKFQWMTIS